MGSELAMGINPLPRPVERMAHSAGFVAIFSSVPVGRRSPGRCAHFRPV